MGNVFVFMKYRKGVFIVTYRRVGDNIEYLILRRKLHWRGWEFPKGGVELFETKKMAVKREIKEETGLKILNLKKLNVSGKYEYEKMLKDRKGIVGQDFVLYAVEISGEKIIFDKKEHSSFKWLKFGEAKKRLTWSNQKSCLKIVNDFLKE